ncbi:flagellar hook capping FlgD N-terminal domain-containing protein [Granulicella sp. L60]|uniref:flagellar hook assembly protein FlgD n=1 Tax=Granulicella sp. L60 TaxID=1641866 RepID=UPI00131EBE12|nr:flagellar hook capping FlgD N-terminal domain-containing protein [Granulicella sp. L60]
MQQINSISTPKPAAAKAVASSLSPKTVTAKAAAGGAPASGAASDSSTITANDFLTLLVSELQNQDPTQPTDPNAYITQLVGVNSLQQLISINQGLTSVETPASDSGGTGGTGTGSNAVANVNAMASVDSLPAAQSMSGQNSIWGGGTTSS